MADKNSTQELKEIRAAALTLDPDERRQTGCFEEPAMEGMKIGSMTGEAEASAGAVSESMLTEEEKIRMCQVVTAAGADYIKTSTGFGPGGATEEDVALFARWVGPKGKIKAAGGIRTVEAGERFLRLGADRLGSSGIVAQCKAKKE